MQLPGKQVVLMAVGGLGGCLGDDPDTHERVGRKLDTSAQIAPHRTTDTSLRTVAPVLGDFA